MYLALIADKIGLWQDDMASPNEGTMKQMRRVGTSNSVG